MPITINMAKARSIHLAEIRRVRDQELIKQDRAWMLAVEAGDTAAQAIIAADKQALRDIPATIDLMTGVDGPEALMGLWPTRLPDRE